MPAALGLLAISALHYWLLGQDCGWLAKGCYLVINGSVPEWYERILMHGPMGLFLLTMLWMWCLREQKKEWRVRYAVGGFLLIGISVGYVSAYHWDGLNGSEATSATIRNIGLAVAAILASIFIVWQNRIAGRQARTAGLKSSADRYRTASVMLSDGNLVVRVSGIQLLGRLSEDDKSYRSMVETLLNRFVRERTLGGFLGTDVVHAQKVIGQL